MSLHVVDDLNPAEPTVLDPKEQIKRAVDVVSLLVVTASMAGLVVMDERAAGRP